MEQGGKLKEQLSITISTYSSTWSNTNSDESTTNAAGHTAIICSNGHASGIGITSFNPQSSAWWCTPRH